jgi:hypothetical protein
MRGSLAFKFDGNPRYDRLRLVENPSGDDSARLGFPNRRPEKTNSKNGNSEPDSRHNVGFPHANSNLRQRNVGHGDRSMQVLLPERRAPVLEAVLLPQQHGTRNHPYASWRGTASALK